jgi:uncharacterized protein (TIGR02611 family)
MGGLLRLLVLTIAIWLIISSVRRLFVLPSFRASFHGQGFHFRSQECRDLYTPPQAKAGRQEETVVTFFGRTLTTTLRQARRLVVTVVGFTVLLIGVAMLVLPGPAVVVVPLGLAILATEFVWAGRLLNRLRQTAGRVGSVFSGKIKANQQ